MYKTVLIAKMMTESNGYLGDHIWPWIMIAVVAVLILLRMSLDN